MNKKNLRKGFTTVELVIVIAVIAILATALIPTFGGLINSANETKYMNEAKSAYTNYMQAKPTEAANATYFIKTSGETYYKVTNGAFDSETQYDEPSCGSKWVAYNSTDFNMTTVTGTCVDEKKADGTTGTDTFCDTCGHKMPNAS